MRGRLGKLSILFLILTVCLAAVGAGHGHWSGSLEISGTAKVEQLCVEFVEQETNDPPGHNYVPGIPGADESIADGFVGSPFRLDKDVGWTECFLFDTDDDGLDDTIEFNIYNAYPCYFGKMIATIGNCGEIPVQVDSVSVSFPDYPGGEYDWTSPPTVGPWPHPPAFEVKWVNGVANVPIVIPPDEVTLIGVWVHVLQPAAHGAEYTFRMTIDVSGPA